MCVEVDYLCPGCLAPVPQAQLIEPCFSVSNNIVDNNHQRRQVVMPLTSELRQNFTCINEGCSLQHQAHPDQRQPLNGIVSCPGCKGLVGLSNTPEQDMDLLVAVVENQNPSFPPRESWGQFRCASQFCAFNPEFMQTFQDQVAEARREQNEADTQLAQAIVAQHHLLNQPQQQQHMQPVQPQQPAQPSVPAYGIKWTPQEDQQLKLLRDQGLTTREISFRMPGRTESAVQTRIQRVIIAPPSVNMQQQQPQQQQPAQPNNNWTPQEDQQLALLRDQGVTVREIGVRLGRTYRAVSARIQRLKDLADN